MSNGNFYKRGSDVITHSTHSYSFFAHSCSFLLILHDACAEGLVLILHNACAAGSVLILHDACAEGFVFILLNACAEKVYTYIKQILPQLSTFHCFLFENVFPFWNCPAMLALARGICTALPRKFQRFKVLGGKFKSRMIINLSAHASCRMSKNEQNEQQEWVRMSRMSRK